MRARQTALGLEIEETDGGVTVRNHLGAAVSQLALQDSRGQLYWKEGIGGEEQCTLEPTDRMTVVRQLREHILDNEPQFPIGGETYDYRYGSRNNGGNLLSRNLMEAQIAALASPMIRELGDRTYVAITARGVDVDLGCDEAVEEASFHIIRGSW